MFEENNNDVDKIYNFHLLLGHFNMLNEPNDLLAQDNLLSANTSLTEAKNTKGAIKTINLGKALIAYAKSLTLLESCEITDDEGALCFICVRYPELELDWIIMQKVLHLLKTNNIEYQEQKTLDLAITLYISAINNKITQLDEQ
ncbi:MAG: hypothetical protein WC758_00030 [Candidatus Woesearchaeota archaeon]|jgi:hypothetical protein